MLVKGGYVHSLKTLLAMHDEEQEARAAGRLRYFVWRFFRNTSFM